MPKNQTDPLPQIPIVYLEVALLARLMTAHSNRCIRAGDVTDVDAMAAYLPYCDAYATDALITGVARSLDLPRTYKCELFDSGTDSITKFIDYLTGTLEAMEPVNRPIFAVIVFPDAAIKANAFEFFLKLGKQARRAERLGQWIEIVASLSTPR